MRSAIALFAVAILSGCAVADEPSGRGPDDLTPSDRSAAAVALAVSRAVDDHRWGDYWALLHPKHQALIGRESFAHCWDRSETGISDKTEIVWVRDVSIEEAGVEGRRAKRARVHFEGHFEGGDAWDETVTRTIVLVGDRWRYLLGSEYVADLEDGRCPVDRQPLDE